MTQTTNEKGEKTMRINFGLKANAIRETAAEIFDRFHAADEFVYYNDIGEIRETGNIKHALLAMLADRDGGGEIEAACYDYDEETEETTREVLGHVDDEDVSEMIEEHKYFYEFYDKRRGEPVEHSEDDLKHVLEEWLYRGDTDTIYVRFLNAAGWVDDAFEITREDIEPDNREFWSIKGNPKQPLLDKIDAMERAAMWEA